MLLTIMYVLSTNRQNQHERGGIALFLFADKMKEMRIVKKVFERFNSITAVIG